jgi:hypothetical protein
MYLQYLYQGGLGGELLLPGGAVGGPILLQGGVGGAVTAPAQYYQLQQPAATGATTVLLQGENGEILNVLVAEDKVPVPYYLRYRYPPVPIVVDPNTFFSDSDPQFFFRIQILILIF